MAAQDVIDRRGTDEDLLLFQQWYKAPGTIEGSFQRELQDCLFHLRGKLGGKAFGHRCSVHQAIESIELERSFDLIELATGVAHQPAGFGDIV
jgi:hypothetical protein